MIFGTYIIGTCIIDDAGRPAAHKKNNENTRFKVESQSRISPNHVLCSCFEGTFVSINF